MPPTPAATKPEPSGSLYEGLLAVQRSAPALQRDSINPHFRNKYISLDSLMPQILPLLNENGLVLLQFPSYIDSPGTGEIIPALTTTIAHAGSKEKVEATMPLILDKQNSQGQGSAITYARRYAVLAILGLVADQDDDGQQASEPPKPKAATQSEVDILMLLLVEEGRTQEEIDSVFNTIRERNRGVLTQEYVQLSTAKAEDRKRQKAADVPAEDAPPAEPVPAEAS